MVVTGIGSVSPNGIGTPRFWTATREGKFDYFKVGYAINAEHAIGVDYGRARDQAAASERAKTYSIAYVYKPVKWAEIYATGKRNKLSRPGTSYHNFDVLVIGTRLKF